MLPIMAFEFPIRHAKYGSQRFVLLQEGTMRCILRMKRKIFYLCIFLLAAGMIWINIYQNRHIGVTEYEVFSYEIPASFDGFKIVQLTDIHSLQDEHMTGQVIEKTAAEQPDLIVITGDLVDSKIYSSQNSALAAGSRQELAGQEMLSLTERLLDIAPVWFVYGNHEMILLDDPQHNPFKTALEDMGVVFLNNRTICLEKGGESIWILGVQDPATLYKDAVFSDAGHNTEEKMHTLLKAVTENIGEDGFTILLSHRPETFEVYQQYPVDLALTGHAHGGQFRIPFLGGLYAPGQGYFPKYTGGIYEENGLKMIVGRGIGNSVIPFRIFNEPEIVSVILRSDSDY